MAYCRSPLGLRGLKFGKKVFNKRADASQPTRAAWIEILAASSLNSKNRSQPTRAAWIEIYEEIKKSLVKQGSQPTRAAWIEI